MGIVNQFYKFEGMNPFSDNQARNFSDDKVSSEFFPVSSFWSLFNDQHEIIIGSRGSGKTFLLKMMRYSMLKRIEDEAAKKIVSDKNFIALYVPMHLEFIQSVVKPEMPLASKIASFQIAFNCILAQSLLKEIGSVLEEFSSHEQAVNTIRISKYLNKTWFNDATSENLDFYSLSRRVNSVFYSFDDSSLDPQSIPIAFRKQMCASLLSVKNEVERILGLSNEPTWIICIDEAEFLDADIQKYINGIFRADSNKIAIKMATLPYMHTTLETTNPAVQVTNGNDFSYKVIDMSFDDPDFISLTNKLCVHRIKSRINPDIEITSLEDFLGKQGNDDLIDYYKLEKGKDNTSYEQIYSDILLNLSDTRRRNSPSYPNPRKTIYDKYAPILFVREMYKMAQKGNYKSSWYAGSNNVRKLSQGNPRTFIKIMYDLFEMSRTRINFSTKTQHEVLYEFARAACHATEALGPDGPIIYKNLEAISQYIHNRIHRGALVSAGSSFRFSKQNELQKNELWLKTAIANSRVVVSNEIMIDFSLATNRTKFLLANIWAMKYWIPMRGDIATVIKSVSDLGAEYPPSQESAQLTMFED